MEKNISKEETKKAVTEALREAADNWPGIAFSREEFLRFAGNPMSLGHLCNLDSQGRGPGGGFYQGRRKMYLKRPAVEWLIERVEV